MSSKLELFYPYKPLVVTQAWGIYNPAYLKFGFDRHNGVDYKLTSKLLAPIRMKITYQGNFPDGGGLQVEGVTTEKYIVPHLDNRECYILFVFCHNKEFLHNVGDILEIGDEIAIPDNTGFSTGNHTHMGAYRLDNNYLKLDTNNAHNSFDFLPYYNGYFAGDATLVKSILNKIIDLLKNFLSTAKVW